MKVKMGIERLCVFGMPPIAFIELARKAGCSCIGIGLEAMRSYNPYNFPDWSFRKSEKLCRETRAALDDMGVEISLLEGFGVLPDMDIQAFRQDLDIAKKLGCGRINLVSADRDKIRTLDNFARCNEIAYELGIEVVSEVGAPPLATMQKAQQALVHVGHENFKLLIDTMHYFRMGSSVDDIALINPAQIGYVQLCDAPWESGFDSYMEEALYERAVPGEGELPLKELLAVLPREVVYSLEVPQRSLVEAGVGTFDRVSACVAGATRLLEQVSIP